MADVSKREMGWGEDARDDEVRVDAAGEVDIRTGDEGAIHRMSVFVFEWPIRLWHWLMVLILIVLGVTGWLIFDPLPSTPGEASDNYLMGYIRFIHFGAGYLLAIAFLFRVYWAFVGNHHAREAFLPPVHKAWWWKGMANMAGWYFFTTKEPRKWVGHNPLAQISMFIFLLFMVFMIFTGFALYSEGAGAGSWQSTWFGWVIPLFGQSQDVRVWHHLGLWGLIIFATLHVYTAVREDIMSRQSMISTMISGERMFKDDRAA